MQSVTFGHDALLHLMDVLFLEVFHGLLAAHPASLAGALPSQDVLRSSTPGMCRASMMMQESRCPAPRVFEARHFGAADTVLIICGSRAGR